MSDESPKLEALIDLAIESLDAALAKLQSERDRPRPDARVIHAFDGLQVAARLARMEKLVIQDWQKGDEE